MNEVKVAVESFSVAVINVVVILDPDSASLPELQ